MLLAFVDDTKFGRDVVFNKSSDLDRAKLEAAVKDIRGTNRVTDQVSRAGCYMCKLLSVQPAVGASCCLCTLLFVQAAVRASCCLCKLAAQYMSLLQGCRSFSIDACDCIALCLWAPRRILSAYSASWLFAGFDLSAVANVVAAWLS